MGARGSKPLEVCKRGHKMSGLNAVPHKGGGRRCRACERAISQVHNTFKSWGTPWDEMDIQLISDEKYRAIQLSQGSALTTGR